MGGGGLAGIPLVSLATQFISEGRKPSLDRLFLSLPSMIVTPVKFSTSSLRLMILQPPAGLWCVTAKFALPLGVYTDCLLHVDRAY